ncbi:hypothetical protein DCCM_0575 [Desulfocucumis palustris]|uniref:Uncharacterized protein n=1 Tax=Desulfocucumis palustris TaxID=1898651 RepID=A0A2L2XEX8_9FIRM|nr:hypothetical protein DCCM_0575 [Desulfocucumis palustris]
MYYILAKPVKSKVISGFIEYGIFYGILITFKIHCGIVISY